MPTKVRTLPALCLLASLASVAGCWGRGPLEVTLTIGAGRPSRSIYSTVGKELLDTVSAPSAGAAYASPPSLSGSSIAYVGVSCAVPSAGTCDQVFHFQTIATGQTVVTYHGAGGSSAIADVTDTLIVR